jgi:hypothetical protein
MVEEAQGTAMAMLYGMMVLGNGKAYHATLLHQS